MQKRHAQNQTVREKHAHTEDRDGHKHTLMLAAYRERSDECQKECVLSVD